MKICCQISAGNRDLSDGNRPSGLRMLPRAASGDNSNLTRFAWPESIFPCGISSGGSLVSDETLRFRDMFSEEVAIVLLSVESCLACSGGGVSAFSSSDESEYSVSADMETSDISSSSIPSWAGIVGFYGTGNHPVAVGSLPMSLCLGSVQVSYLVPLAPAKSGCVRKTGTMREACTLDVVDGGGRVNNGNNGSTCQRILTSEMVTDSTSAALVSHGAVLWGLSETEGW